MIASLIESFSLLAALAAILMVGSSHLKLNIQMLAIEGAILAFVTALCANLRAENHVYWFAAALFVVKALGVPLFLLFILRKVNVERDSSVFVPAPLAMHLSVGCLALSYFFANLLPVPAIAGASLSTATASISLIVTGLLMMLTRRIALSQILGFLIMESGIYLFGIIHTRGMPLLIEMGVLLDVLAGVMIAGLITFRIKKNFEHIDLTKLTELKE